MTNLPPIGARIYYTGDMANIEGWCVVTRHRAATPYSRAGADLTMEDGRIWAAVNPAQWAKSPGRRFIMEAEYEADRAAKLAEMQERYATVAAQFTAARPEYPRMLAR